MRVQVDMYTNRDGVIKLLGVYVCVCVCVCVCVIVCMRMCVSIHIYVHYYERLSACEYHRVNLDAWSVSFV
jgi:hypothetical protein